MIIVYVIVRVDIIRNDKLLGVNWSTPSAYQKAVI